MSTFMLKGIVNLSYPKLVKKIWHKNTVDLKRHIITEIIEKAADKSKYEDITVSNVLLFKDFRKVQRVETATVGEIYAEYVVRK